MSNPSEYWWSYALRVIYNYPKLHEELRQLKSQKITPGYSKDGGRSMASRKTENIAIKGLPDRQQKYHDAVELSLEQTRLMQDGKLRCRFIALRFFQGKKGNHTIQEAADKVHVSYGTGKNWNREFVRLVGKNLIKLGVL